MDTECLICQSKFDADEYTFLCPNCGQTYVMSEFDELMTLLTEEQVKLLRSNYLE